MMQCKYLLKNFLNISNTTFCVLRVWAKGSTSGIIVSSLMWLTQTMVVLYCTLSLNRISDLPGLINKRARFKFRNRLIVYSILFKHRKTWISLLCLVRFCNKPGPHKELPAYHARSLWEVPQPQSRQRGTSHGVVGHSPGSILFCQPPPLILSIPLLPL